MGLVEFRTPLPRWRDLLEGWPRKSAPSIGQLGTCGVSFCFSFGSSIFSSPGISITILFSSLSSINLSSLVISICSFLFIRFTFSILFIKLCFSLLWLIIFITKVGRIFMKWFIIDGITNLPGFETTGRFVYLSYHKLYLKQIFN